MSIVLITIRDTEDGGLDVRLEAEPPIRSAQNTLAQNTPAHYAGLMALKALEELSEE